MSSEPFESPQPFSTGFSKQREPGHCESRSWGQRVERVGFQTGGELGTLHPLGLCQCGTPPQAAHWGVLSSGLGQLSSSGDSGSAQAFLCIAVLYSSFAQGRKFCLAARAEELRVWALPGALPRRWNLPRSRAGLCQPRSPNHPDLGVPFPPWGHPKVSWQGEEGHSSLIPRAFWAGFKDLPTLLRFC